MPDKSQNTEKATPQKLKKAREEGRFPVARDFVAAIQFTAFVAWLGFAGPAWFEQLRVTARLLLEQAFRSELSPSQFIDLLLTISRRCLAPLGPLAAVLLGITLFMQLVTTGFGFSATKLMPDLQRLNPMSKLTELPRQNIPAFIQAVILLPVFGYLVYGIVRAHLIDYYNLPVQSLQASFHTVTASLQDLLWKASGGFVVFGLVNLFRQRMNFNTDLKMSKQEIKDESKQQEGSPQIKARVRRLQRDLRRRSMMKDIAKATAVIVNPTHYAIAIRYQMSGMSAPTVLAKGKNYLALRIKKKALDHQIPIIENASLAQALFKSAEVGQEIPAHLFKAVAEVLAYIYRVMNGCMPGQDD